MQVEPTNIPGKSHVQQVQSSPPVQNPIAVKDENEVKKKEKPPELSQTMELAVELQENLKALHNVDLRFSVHAASGRTMVTVTDEETGKVVREIPPHELLNLAAKLEEMMGLIFDQKA